MNILQSTNLEEMIISLLSDGEKNTTALLQEIRELRKRTTKQGFYAALRKLRKEEVVLLYKGKATLHTSWITDMQNKIEQINKAYTVEANSFDILSLDDKESVSYIFSTIKHLDTFWGHSQNILIHKTLNNNPIFAYDPHYWFYIARKEAEEKLLKILSKNRRQFLMTVGYNTKLDKVTKKDFRGDYLQYNIQKLFEKQNYYVTVIDDYITEVYLDPTINKKVMDLYISNHVINQNLINEFQKILQSKSKSRIKISRNKRRAEQLKKKMGKNFYIINS